MKPTIKKDLILRISEAEIVESQLSSNDLRALQGQNSNGGETDGVLCPNVYCSSGYSDESMLEQIFNPSFLQQASK